MPPERVLVNTRPYPYTWLNRYISPGPVGSVGGVNLQPRFKHSAPDLPIRWDARFAGPMEPRQGSNISDGLFLGYSSHGPVARLLDTNWGLRTDFKYGNGWRFQDLKAPDRFAETTMGSTPDYSWHNKLATVVEAKNTGNKFMPLPGGFGPPQGSIPNGGAYPRIVAQTQATVPPWDSVNFVTAPVVENPTFAGNEHDQDVPIEKRIAESLKSRKHPVHLATSAANGRPYPARASVGRPSRQSEPIGRPDFHNDRTDTSYLNRLFNQLFSNK